MDEITLDGKTYVSSKRAAAITGYAKDYVGQLCREGRIEARLVGRNWYILESSIREHRFGKEEKKEPVKTEDGAYEPANYASEPLESIPTIDASQKISEPPFEPSFDHSNTVQEMQNAWQDWFSRKNIELPAQLQEDLLETPEIINARDEGAVEDPTEVVHVIKELPETPRTVVEAPPYQPEYTAPSTGTRVVFEEDEETVPLHRSYAIPSVATPAATNARAVYQPSYVPSTSPREPLYASPRPEGRIVRERRVIKKKKPSVALQALFLTIAGVAIAVALIGSGHADTFLNQNKIQYAPINFIGGQTTVYRVNK